MRIGIVGGGITGLALTHALARRGIDSVLFERSTRPGGVIQTRVCDGDTFEVGPQRTRLTWTVTSPDAVTGFEVRVRRGDTIRTAAVLRRPNVRELVVERPERDRVFYRVLAIGEGGQIIARSNEVRVTNGENRPEATPTPEGASDG